MWKMVSSILLLLFSFSLKLSDAGQCPDTWLDFGNSCYKYIEEKVSWYNAHVICRIADSHMIQINSKAEDDFAVQLARKNGVSLWIGMSDLTQEGNFLLDGTLQNPSYTHWWPGEPSNYQGNEDCVMLYDIINYFWNDASCDAKFPTICEKRAKDWD